MWWAPRPGPIEAARVGAGRGSTARPWSRRSVGTYRALIHPRVSFKFKFDRLNSKLVIFDY
jgi:hypothetical protein